MALHPPSYLPFPPLYFLSLYTHHIPAESYTVRHYKLAWSPFESSMTTILARLPGPSEPHWEAWALSILFSTSSELPLSPWQSSTVSPAILLLSALWISNGSIRASWLVECQSFEILQARIWPKKGAAKTWKRADPREAKLDSVESQACFGGNWILIESC